VARPRIVRSRVLMENTVGIVAVGIVLAAIVTASLYNIVVSLMPRPAPATGSATDGFAESRTARIVFVSPDGGPCREILFKNDTGRFSEGRPVPCNSAVASAPAADSPKPTLGGALDSFRDAFNPKR
jgi:hypothetical protein